ncbi:uncharacterized protein [Bombus fervidus]|uniref:uncharacterized protein n=1 Tax=Bombus fervidus TaxID=203811 RepID=UPI003AB5E631
MSSEEGASNSQKKNETRLEESLKKNGNQSIEQSTKSSKVIQLESKLNGDQAKLSNKLGDNSAKNHLSSKASIAFTNGTRSVQSNTCSFTNSMDQDTSQDILNASVSSMFLNTNNIKSQTMNTAVTSQLKHKTVMSTSALNLPKPPVHINLSSSQNNTHVNHCISGSYNTGATSSATLYLNNSAPVSSAIQSNISTAKPNEDIDMKNNVDYISGIEKCPSKVSCSSDSSPEMGSVWASRSYGSNSLLNNIGGSIGSTSQGTCCFLRPNINGNREVPGPSGLQKNTQREQNERKDSSSGNEGDMSDGEDYCIYIYKGNDDVVYLIQKEEINQGQVEEREEDEQCHSGRSSPEMDFLEMDFDPGPSCEQDTGDSDMASINEDIQNIALDNVDPDPVLNDLSSGKVVAKQGITATSQNPKQSIQNVNNAELQQCSSSNPSVPEPSIQPNYPSPWMPSTSNSGAAKWETTKMHCKRKCPLQESYGYHSTSGDLISPGDNRDSDAELWVESSSASVPENSNLSSRRVNLSSTLYHRMMAKKLMLNKQAAFNQSGDSNLENELSNERLDGLIIVEKVMLWSEQEATVKQVTQIATSACGATAAINALLALNVPFSLETLIKGVNTRQRELGTPLPRYLYSRSIAGSTHGDLARGIALCTNGSVITKFFAFYPERKVSLSHWLHYWISKGAVPIATLNLQHCGGGYDIPDAWHHQMIFGVGQAGIYLTNPLECLPEQYVWHQLVSPSILLVRRADVLAHWNPNTDLTPLAVMDQKWRKLNVFGQVVNMIRDTQRRQLKNQTTSVTHIRIPASYQAGITLVMCADSAAASELLHTEQLPLL